MQVEPTTTITTKDWIGWIIGGIAVVVYILTLIRIYVYTNETRKMQQAVTKQAEAANRQIVLLTDQIDVSHRQLAEMGEQSKIYRSQADELIHQTRLSFMPAFIAEIVQDKRYAQGITDFGYRLVLTNVGCGVALSLYVDNVPIPLNTLDEATPIHDEGLRSLLLNRQVVFEPTPFVRPDQSVTLQHTSKSGENEYFSDLFSDMVEKYAGDRVFEVSVTFADVEGNKYQQVILTGKGGCRPGPVIPVR